MNRRDVLEKAIQVICEDRNTQYGDLEDNLQIIADFWNVYLFRDSVIKPADVANMMILLKLARNKTGRNKLDNYVDIAGYAACGAERMTADESKIENLYAKLSEHDFKRKNPREE